MKKCKECGIDYSGFLVSHSSKYCSENCRKKVRAKVNKSNIDEIIGKINNKDIDFIAKDVYLKYKNRSPKRNIEFNLSLDFFKKNVFAPCFYCGDKIDKVGFDRVDNNKGYTEDNCVPCCGDCNLMKRSNTLDVFISKCIKIALKHNKQI